MNVLYFVLAVFFYGVSQSITFGKFRLKVDFWTNWSRKYKQPLEPAPNTWYYRLATLKYRERFPGSGSIFVSLVDGYHLSQFFYKVCLMLAIVSYRPWLGIWDAAVYMALWGVIFTATNRLVSA